ncbi:hypothetical protein NE236_40230 [Actinoallomurus purpureus]|uniref:hypothetical protein n=1 Tax=Actinoallomurus purpureus TaxID=478114 RepID=UPI002092288B|nr:hypothetical protein [Actinoallomurus purpureus]MCO6011200.1 hypothetical protein [Actinoallomurus purpureus]
MSDDWWVDNRQDRQIRDLQSELNAAYDDAERRSRTLQSKLSEVQGTLERRIDRLARSFDAFVELSDLRLELAAFDREIAIRGETRRLLTSLAREVTDPPRRETAECPGYWLGPAAEALHALVRGDEVAAESHATEATRRDEPRTALFLTLALAVAGRDTLAAPWLARTLPPLGTTVTRVQRRLWTACAEGVFGEMGRSHIERRLAEFVDGLPADAVAGEGRAWREKIASVVGRAETSWMPRTLQGEAALTEPPANAARLARLRARVEETLPAAEPPAGTPDDTSLAEFARLLTVLVDEGSPDEAPLIARARELRRIIENGDSEQPRAWDAPGGETLALLRGDMFDKAAPALRSLALRTGRRWIAEAAGDLAEKASRPLPARVRVRVGGWHLSVGPDGTESTAELEAGVDDVYATSPVAERAGLSLAVAGVLVLVLTAVAGIPALAVLAGVVAIAGAVLWITRRLGRRAAAESAVREKDRLIREAGQITEAIREHRSRYETLATSAAKDRDAILTIVD